MLEKFNTIAEEVISKAKINEEAEGLTENEPVSDGSDLYKKVKATPGENRCKKCDFLERDQDGHPECTAPIGEYFDTCRAENCYFVKMPME